MWAAGDAVDVETEDGLLRARVLGPSHGNPSSSDDGAGAEEMRVEFVDGDTADWPVIDFHRPATVADDDDPSTASAAAAAGAAAELIYVCLGKWPTQSRC